MKKSGWSRIFELTSSPGDTLNNLTSQIAQPNPLPGCPHLTHNLLLHIGQDVANAALGKIIIEAGTEVWRLQQERPAPDGVYTEHLTTAKSHLPLSLLRQDFATA